MIAPVVWSAPCFNSTLLATMKWQFLEDSVRYDRGNVGYLISISFSFPKMCRGINLHCSFCSSLIIPHRIHVYGILYILYNIHLHLVDFYSKCRDIYHTWILWVLQYGHVWQKLPASISRRRFFAIHRWGCFVVGSSSASGVFCFRVCEQLVSSRKKKHHNKQVDLIFPVILK